MSENKGKKRLTPREQELAFLDSVIEAHNKMTIEERRAIAIRAGILDDEGRLTKEYGGEADPSDKYVPKDMTA